MNKKIWRYVLVAALVMYLVILLRITVFRSTFSFANICTKGTINPAPFADLLDTLRTRGVGWFLYLFIGNIVWFVPLGMLVPCVSANMRSARRVVLLSFFMSLIIEIAQYVFGTGISELDDLLLNTAGGAVGYAIFYVIRRLFYASKL